MTRQEPILLIIAPTIILAKQTAEDHGLDIATMVNTRTVLRPRLLRGWRDGTPYIAKDPDSWEMISREGEIMADLLFIAVRRGGLRPANDADLARCKPERVMA